MKWSVYVVLLYLMSPCSRHLRVPLCSTNATQNVFGETSPERFDLKDIEKYPDQKYPVSFLHLYISILLITQKISNL